MTLSPEQAPSPLHTDELAGQWDVAVVGAGFGGLGAALRLAERGARVLVLETLNYPGGCASTFTRGGASFESGATLFSGLGEGGLFRRWIDRLGLDVEVDWLDPVVELRAPGFALPIAADRGDLERRLAALPGAPVEGLRRFFAHQKKVADVLWELLEDPRFLPPFEPRTLLSHVRRLPRYVPLLRDVGRPLADVLARYSIQDFAPLRQLLDALCQITVQCGADEAEAPFALGTLDYYWRGTGHVRGGIGRLAHGLVEGLRSLGGDVGYATRVRRIERADNAWRLHTRRGVVQADRVVANLLPQALDRLLDPGVVRPRRVKHLTRDVERGWGACMLYLVLRPEEARPRHVQLIADAERPFIEGNHVFCSISGVDDGPRAPGGHMTATVSTHVPMDRLRELEGERRAEYVAGIQERMRATLRERAPEIDERIVHVLTASPRTFERFTGRFLGYVGGVPRRAGWGHYLRSTNPEIAPGLQLVGDSVFPGQSTLAAALGGWKAAERWRPTVPAGSRRTSSAGAGSRSCGTSDAGEVPA